MSTLRLVHAARAEPVRSSELRTQAERRTAVILVLLGLVLLFVG